MIKINLKKSGMAMVFAGLFGLAPTAFAQSFQLQSSDVSNHNPMADRFAFKGFGCTGENISPALAWQNAPAGTKSFAVMVHDPDAVTGGAGFWHWVVINLPASLSGLRQGDGSADGARLPPGTRQIATDFGTPGWGGPCPPVGDAPTATTSPCTP